MPRLRESLTIYCSSQVRAQLPEPLAARWRRQYPRIVDADDLRLAFSQRTNHFCEWYAAIHLYRRYGALSLVEKYMVYRSHPRKMALVERLLSETERKRLRAISVQYHVQAPDLLVYTPDRSRFWFAEVKGPGDRLAAKQLRSHAATRKRLKVPVQVIRVVMQGGGA